MLKQLCDMTAKRFKVSEYLIQNKPWDFLMLVEIGVDRIHHAFWKFFDKQHRLYQPGSKYENAVKEYYQLIDNEIGKLLKLIDKNTTVIVVSDHGAERMKGAFSISEWGARSTRAYAGEQLPKFVEVYLKCSLEECMRRDLKGLYEKALAGEITNMTGIQDPYEESLNPEVTLNTENDRPQRKIRRVVQKLQHLGYLDQ